MSKSFPLFATGSDLLGLLAAVELQRPLRYVVAGTSAKEDPQSFNSSLQLPNLGRATAGDQNRETFYLVVDAKERVEARVIPQSGSETRFSFDQQANPRSVIIRPGGVFQDKCMIAGQVGTSSLEKESVALIKLFSKELRQQFAKVKSYYVGEEAIRLLDSGMRLTSSVQAPADYDLKKG